MQTIHDTTDLWSQRHTQATPKFDHGAVVRVKHRRKQRGCAGPWVVDMMAAWAEGGGPGVWRYSLSRPDGFQARQFRRGRWQKYQMNTVAFEEELFTGAFAIDMGKNLVRG